MKLELLYFHSNPNGYRNFEKKSFIFYVGIILILFKCWKPLIMLINRARLKTVVWLIDRKFIYHYSYGNTLNTFFTIKMNEKLSISRIPTVIITIIHDDIDIWSGTLFWNDKFVFRPDSEAVNSVSLIHTLINNV